MRGYERSAASGALAEGGANARSGKENVAVDSAQADNIHSDSRAAGPSSQPPTGHNKTRPDQASSNDEEEYIPA